MELSWLLPESFSTFGRDIDRLYYVILWITGVVFMLTEGVLVFFVVRYRHREGRQAQYVHGDSRLEVVWTTATAAIVIGLGIASIGVWHEVKRDVPPDAIEVIVTGKQFEWTVTYPGADGALGTADDFVRRNALHVPDGRPVLVHLRSEDVIHSFFVPDLRVKQDALPGKSIQVWFEATQPGTYPIGCAELCGLGHYRMAAELTVHAAEDYQAWLQAELAQEDQ